MQLRESISNYCEAERSTWTMRPAVGLVFIASTLLALIIIQTDPSMKIDVSTKVCHHPCFWCTSWEYLCITQEVGASNLALNTGIMVPEIQLSDNHG